MLRRFARSYPFRRHYNGSDMPAGDAQRVWFSEMVERLRSRWQEGTSLEALIKLRDELDAMLAQIRSERAIRTPVFTCPRCGSTGPGAKPHVSVRATIFALARFGIATGDPKALEEDWAAFQCSRL
jgi:hypothetical protein